MTLNEGLQLALPVIGCLGLYILNNLSKSVDRVTEKLGEVSESVAAGAVRTSFHTEEINKIYQNIDSLPCKNSRSCGFDELRDQ